MGNIINAKNIIKTYAQPIRSSGVLGGLRDLFHRDYNYINAVDGISLAVKQGEFLGYIGPNGAGKSTSIKILTGILQATSGTVEVLGLDPFKNRREYTRQIGVVFGQRTQLWWDIAVKESFSLLKRIYQIPENEFTQRLCNLVDLFEVGKLLNTPVRKLSLGERMKCDLVASLLHKPAILFLDEPTIGLDTIAKESIRIFLKKLHEMGDTTILLTTHDLQEIEELCQRIVVLDKGVFVYDGDLEKIKQLAGISRTMVLECEVSPTQEDKKTIASIAGVISITIRNKSLEIDFNPQNIPVPVLLEKITRLHQIRDLRITEPSIEKVITKLYRQGFARIDA
jgi:ABC-2 type transport system ATP-binding protein